MTSPIFRLDLRLSFINSRTTEALFNAAASLCMCFSLSLCRTFALHTCRLVCDRVQVKSIRCELSKQSIELDQVLREASQFPSDRGLFALYWAPAVARKPKPSGGVNTGPFMPRYGTRRCLSDPDQRPKVLHRSRLSLRCCVGSYSLTHWLVDTRFATWIWSVHLLTQTGSMQIEGDNNVYFSIMTVKPSTLFIKSF